MTLPRGERTLSDETLLKGAFAGDERSRRELVHRLVPTVASRVRHTLLRYRRAGTIEQAAEDMTQQVFLALFENGARKLRAWDGSRNVSLSAFVGLLSEREVLSILRRARRNPFHESPSPDEFLERAMGGAGGLERQIESRELLDLVLDRALEGLDERRLLYFHRLIVDEAEVDAVAAEAGTTRAALHMWKSRFTAAVREIARCLSSDPSRLTIGNAESLRLPASARLS